MPGYGLRRPLHFTPETLPDARPDTPQSHHLTAANYSAPGLRARYLTTIQHIRVSKEIVRCTLRRL